MVRSTNDTFIDQQLHVEALCGGAESGAKRLKLARRDDTVGELLHLQKKCARMAMHACVDQLHSLENSTVDSYRFMVHKPLEPKGTAGGQGLLMDHKFLSTCYILHSDWSLLLLVNTHGSFHCKQGMLLVNM